MSGAGIHSTLGLPPESHRLFGKYLECWRLEPDGPPLVTQSSDLLPVLYNRTTPAMLKVAKCAEERSGNALMVWWNGEGAAKVFAHEGDALLMERAIGTRSLIEMVRSGADGEATATICRVAEQLHAPRSKPLPHLTPLQLWFEELAPAASRYGGILRRSLEVSRELLEQPQEQVVLHGDIHHGNILDGGHRGWIAIDPKGLIGERGFDFANIFCNPDYESATRPGRLASQTAIVADYARVHRNRLLKWVLAYAGLSAAWSLNARSEDPATALAVAHIAAAELDSF